MLSRGRTLRLIAAGLLLPSCAGKARGGIRVATGDDRNEVVAEIYAAALAREGIAVERAARGEVDVYAALVPTAKAASGWTQLSPAPAKECQAFAASQYVAQKYYLVSMAQCSRLAPQLRLAASSDFAASGTLDRLRKAYGGFKFGKIIECAPGTECDLLNRDDADIAPVSNADPRVGLDQLAVLRDERHVFPLYQVAPFVRATVIHTHPQVPRILNHISARLNLYALQTVNMRSRLAGMDARFVAEEFVAKSESTPPERPRH